MKCRKNTEKNDIGRYSRHNKGKSVVAEKFVKTLKNKFYKYMPSTPRNVYIEKLDDIVNKYNNTYRSTIKIKPSDVNTCINSSKENNDEDLKFKIGDVVRISKYKNIFAKGYVPNWSEDVFLIKVVKSTVPWVYVTSDLKGEKMLGTFYEKELQKTSQKGFRVEIIIKTKNDKIYVKWEDYCSSFNSWIDKEVIVKMSKYFSEPKSSRKGVKVELDLCIYATKV